MAKSKKLPKSREPYPKLPAPTTKNPAPHPSHAVRETVESIVIAFVLAFLFRTFEAEAFVIPTGSMAPTLMGQHKDVDCPKCGHRYRVSASEEAPDRMLAGRAQPWGGGPLRAVGMAEQVVAGECPICHYVMAMRPDISPDLPGGRNVQDIPKQPTYNGDRILVNKYIYTFSDPNRWDVVVFKFPGDAQQNYIKRLVGLPNEVVRIDHGDLYIGGEGAAGAADFEIARKPADTVLAMRQLVHDTDYDPAVLYNAGWPLSWRAVAEAGGVEGWQVDAKADGSDLKQRFVVRSNGDEAHWLRYQHLMPDDNVWQAAIAAANETDPSSEPAVNRDRLQAAAQPSLIMDFNAYNTRVLRVQAERMGTLAPDPSKTGVHWVGDLMVEANVEIVAAQGELTLDLVEGGKHFTCRIDLSTGQARLTAEGQDSYSPVAGTSLDSPGDYHVAFANFDDRLLLWIDGDLVDFDGETAYDSSQVFGPREQIRPRTGDDDPGDLAPVGVGVRNANLAVTRLQVWRDIYYIADSSRRNPGRLGSLITDYDRLSPELLTRLPYDPALWDQFENRRYEDFPLGKDQFFVMGDNSAESSDARLWSDGASRSGGRPGGAYFERRLLVGKALCVYWPHSWNRVPGTPIPFPLLPNFADMRLVR